MDPRIDAQQADALQKLSEQYVLDVEVDREAPVKGLRNWDEVQKAVNEAMDVVFKGSPPAEAEKVRAPMKQIFGNRQQAEPLLLKDITLFLAPLGREYIRGKPITYDDVLPNPFGGKPFPAIGSFTLHSVEAGIAKVAFRQTLDPQQTAAILRETVGELAQRTAGTRPATIPIEDFQISDSADFEIVVTAGMPRRMRHQREMKGMGGSRVDSMQVELER